jgi:hypothetical protein
MVPDAPSTYSVCIHGCEEMFPFLQNLSKSLVPFLFAIGSKGGSRPFQFYLFMSGNSQCSDLDRDRLIEITTKGRYEENPFRENFSTDDMEMCRRFGWTRETSERVVAANPQMPTIEQVEMNFQEEHGCTIGVIASGNDEGDAIELSFTRDTTGEGNALHCYHTQWGKLNLIPTFNGEQIHYAHLGERLILIREEDGSLYFRETTYANGDQRHIFYPVRLWKNAAGKFCSELPWEYFQNTSHVPNMTASSDLCIGTKSITRFLRNFWHEVPLGDALIIITAVAILAGIALTFVTLAGGLMLLAGGLPLLIMLLFNYFVQRP